MVILYQKSTIKESSVKITQLLQSSVVEIITTLTVTATLFSAAKTLASIYISVGLVAKGQELLHQLRHIIIFHEGWGTSDFTLKLDAHVTRVVFAFLVSFELELSGKGTKVSYSDLMASIIYESVLYEEYSRVIAKGEHIEVILECGAKLRGFWEENSRTQLISILDKKLLELFRKEYAGAFKSISEEHVHLFYVALLVELSKDRQATKIDFAVLACRAGNTKVKALLEARQFQQAHQVGRCAFHFGSKQHLYQRRDCIQYGYKLAELLAGIDVPHPATTDDLSRAMLVTSRDIMAEALAGARAANIDWASLRFEDLAGLIRLLGAQSNFGELEVILSRLWATREELQRSSGWSPTMVLQVGTLLVHAQQAHGHASAAVDTAELLYYNVRRGRGRLHPETLAVARLLGGLYLNAGRTDHAAGIYEGVLREVASASHHQGHSSIRPELVTETKLQLERLREAHVLSKGGKAKSTGELRDLYERLRSDLKLDTPAFDQWVEAGNAGKGTRVGDYRSIGNWKIIKTGKSGDLWKRTSRNRSKQDSETVSPANQWWLVY